MTTFTLPEGATCFNDQTPRSLPNTQDLDQALAILSAASSSFCHLQWRVQRIARGALVGDFPEYALVEGDEIPTFAHIGEFYAFALEARERFGEAVGYLDTFEKNLENLEWARRFAAEVVDDA